MALLTSTLIVFVIAAPAVAVLPPATPSAAAAAAPSPSPVIDPSAGRAAPADFVRSKCADTLYHDLCVTSLMPYASHVNFSSPRLARAAVAVALRHTRALSARILVLQRRASVSPQGDHATSALRDCVDTVGSAVELATRAAAEAEKLPSRNASAAAAASTNALTWLSAAMTDEETCTDGLDDAEVAGKLKTEVTARVRGVQHYTSNALALVRAVGRHG